MKKILIIFLLILISTGCQEKTKDEFKEIKINESIKQDKYIDNNPIKVSLYQYNTKIKSYSTILGNFKLIGVFNVYYTDKDTLDSSNIKYNYKKYYNQYNNIENYKNGFYIKYEVKDKTIEKLILDPTSKHSMAPYLYIYLYDDINQLDGAFYNHLEPEDMKDNTIISSIKLFTAHKGTEIISPITLTVFTYDNQDDFTKDKIYRGRSSYTIEIQTK